MPGRPTDYSKKIQGGLERRLSVLESIVANLAYPGELRSFAMPEPPNGWLEADGAVIAVEDYENLADAIYCGDGNNGSADWGYRCTNSGSPSSSRSVSGPYIVLPDFRGEFVRGFDNGRGVDSGRNLWASQADANKSHTHTAATDSQGIHDHGGSVSSVSAGTPSGSITGDGSHSHNVRFGSISNTAASGGAQRVTDITSLGANFYTTSGAEGTHSHGFSGSALPGHSHTIPSAGAHTHTVTVDAAGGTETRVKNLAALICIKT